MNDRAQTDLAQHIHNLPLFDTHEHLCSEDDYVTQGPDVLQDLFDNYVRSDLIVAGASPAALERLYDAGDPDIAGRFAGIREVWEKCRHTGYGEAVRLIARHVYAMEEITSPALESAEKTNRQLRRPGERRRLLKEVANLDHVQIDNFCWPALPDRSGLDFFLYDIRVTAFCAGYIEAQAIKVGDKTLFEETGVEVCDLPSLRHAISTIFAKYGACAIAVKASHAYQRTLFWQERTEEEAERALQKALTGRELSEAERLCLGDWCWARCVELAIEHNLPFKIHTGTYAGTGALPIERIRAGHLCDLLQKYPRARFVLMHAAYPYGTELVALAKHYPNVYIDLCWAWSIDPYSTRDVVRRILHAVPSNKIFAFGGDTRWPGAVVAYALQARQWLTSALQNEIDDGALQEREAIALATRWMNTNQQECFDLAGTRAAIRAEAVACDS